jgi:nicotinamidase-related amidase
VDRLASAALILIDLQTAVDDPRWAAEGPRNHPEAEARIGRLLAAWRAAKRPIFHVRHDSTEPASSYRPGGPGHGFKPEAAPAPGEPVIPKSVHSAFVGTDLHLRLHALGVTTLVVAGVVTNNSVEATVRHAADMGYAVLLAEDACFTFARRDFAGVLRTADEVHAMSLANLAGEYCEVTTTAALVDA